MVEVVQIEDLEIDALSAGVDVLSNPIGGLGKGSGGAIYPDLVGFATDGLGPPAELGLGGTDSRGLGDRIHEGCRVAPDLLTRRPHPPAQHDEVLDGSEGPVELVGVPCRQVRRALQALPADDDRWVGALSGLREARGVDHGERPALVVEQPAVRSCPHAGDDGQLVLEHVESAAETRERDAVGGVLLVIPPSTKAEFDATTAHLIDLGDADGEDAGMAERGGGHERPEPDRGRVASQTGERDERIRRARSTGHSTHLQVVIGPEETSEAESLGVEGHRKQVVVTRSLLGFGEDAYGADVHRAEVTGRADDYRRSTMDLVTSSALRDHVLAHSVKTGEFTLKSGATSTWFLDTKQTACRPEGIVLVADAALAVIPTDATAIGGLTMGADPVAFGIAAIAATRGRPLRSFSVRKEAKDHGVTGRIAGALVPGDRVVVTEDTVTRGTSIMEAVDVVTAFGATVVAIVVIVDRGGTCGAMAAERGIPFLPLLTAPDLGYGYGT